jgi:HD-GYP domain-containing protein (c-di-GMP phosphodiesterase class II)
MASRVIAVCDAFNAMTTDRPYRDAMSVASAVAELRATAGTQFDPNIVEAVIALVSTWGDEGAGPRIDEPVLATVAAPS